MRRLYEIARVTFTQLFPRYLLLITVAALLFIAVIKITGGETAPGFIYSIFHVLTLYYAIHIGATLLAPDIESGTVRIMLAGPLSRTEYILGKITGAFLHLFVLWLVLSASLFIADGAFPPGGMEPVLFLEILLIAALSGTMMICATAAFTAGLRPVIGGCLVLALFLIQMGMTRMENGMNENAAVKLFLTVMPSFEKMSLTRNIMENTAPPPGDYLLVLLHIVTYSAVLVLVGTAVFSRRDL